MKQQEGKTVSVQVEQDKDILEKVKEILNKEWVNMLISSILIMITFISWLVVNDLIGNKLRTETKALGYTMVIISVMAQLYMQIKILFL